MKFLLMLLLFASCATAGYRESEFVRATLVRKEQISLVRWRYEYVTQDGMHMEYIGGARDNLVGACYRVLPCQSKRTWR